VEPFLKGGGTLTNTGAITGGGLGVYIADGGTVTNSGTISGGTASVEFAGSGTNTLTLQTGSTLTGAAFGSTTSGATNALILQGHGTANNNFVAFNTLNAQGSGTWTLGGSSTFGDTIVSTGTLAVSGALTSTTLEIQAGAQLNDTGDVSVDGAVTNRGNLTISGVTMHVVGAGGTFSQLAGGTTTLLNGGVLDPSHIVIDSGVFGGGGSVVGDVSVTGGTVKAGGVPSDSLKILGNFSQTGGEIVFEVDPNGHGGFMESTLNFSASVLISDTTLVFDFLNGANAQQFVDDDLLNLDTFFGLIGGGQFCTELNCGTVLNDISFASNVPGLTISGFDPMTGAIDPTTGAMSLQAVPEPGTWALLMTGTVGLGSLKLRRRNGSRMI
jgi:PEP-CTERM motif